MAGTISITRTGAEIVLPARLRATVAFCAATGQVEAAADLARRYLSRSELSPVDTHERATAFDRTLRERFPAYAAARSGRH
ncbi:hypothetical protein AB0H71_32525 [Nocardia sp. NPDC050697]|uniref:hypothetical protein n=1 Tax=Nocardia sp. NPDC050697 TaxID=3155158 RepID=UPI0033C0E69F